MHASIDVTTVIYHNQRTSRVDSVNASTAYTYPLWAGASSSPAESKRSNGGSRVVPSGSCSISGLRASELSTLSVLSARWISPGILLSRHNASACA